MKKLTLIFFALIVAACSGSKVEEPNELTGDAVQGQLLYESGQLGCVTCHGTDGQLTIFRPIDSTASLYSFDGQDYTLERYIELFMPTAATDDCDAQCAFDIAAYIRTWEQPVDPGENPEADNTALFSATVRLTNDEYYAALTDLVLPDQLERAELLKQIELSDELEVGGLVSAEGRQQLSQIAFSRFLKAAGEAANLRLLGDGVNALSLENFNASILCSTPSLSPEECIRERGLDYIERGFRGQATQEDINNLDSLLASFDALLAADEAFTEPDLEGVEVFLDCDYAGESLLLTEGDYRYADLNPLGFGNSISSILIGSGYRATLFVNNLRGDTLSRTANDDCLEDDTFDNIASSVRIERVVIDPAEELARLVLRYQSVVQFVALSPKFVMLLEKGEAARDDGNKRPLTEKEIANRLAFFIAGTPPDEALMAAANNGELTNPSERRTQASRLITEESSAAGTEKIVTSWLGLNPLLANESAVAETQTFIKNWIAERRPFSDLYTSAVAVENVDTTVTQEPFGILGLEAVIASHTNDPVPSFINRGEFIVADLLCGQLPNDVPDEAIADIVEDPVEVFESHAKEPCATCHVVFDNYGAALQRFDSVNYQYDPTNDWLGTDFELYQIGDVSGTVTSVDELSAILGTSYQAHTCFAELWYRHAIRRDMLPGENTADDAVLDAIVAEWIAGETSVASLLELIAGHEGFSTLYR